MNTKFLMNTCSSLESQRMTARHEPLVIAVTSILLLFSALQTKGGIAPVPTVTGLCAEATVIVEGDVVGNGQVKVLKIYKGAEQVGTNSEIVVAGLENAASESEKTGRTMGRIFKQTTSFYSWTHNCNRFT